LKSPIGGLFQKTEIENNAGQIRFFRNKMARDPLVRRPERSVLEPSRSNEAGKLPGE
jgi:hypothetical protein